MSRIIGLGHNYPKGGEVGRSPHRLGAKYVPLPDKPSSITHTFENVEGLLYTTKGDWLSHRKIGNNTYLQRTDDGVALILHETAILTWHDDDTLTIRNGGWFTNLTSDRLRSWLPDRRQWNGEKWEGPALRQGSDKGFWYITNGQQTFWFHDGMVMDLHTFTEFSTVYDPSDDRKWNAAIDRKIEKYLRKVDENTEFSYNAVQRDLEPAALMMRCLDNDLYPSELWDYTPDRGWGFNRSTKTMRRELRMMFRLHLHRGKRASRFQRTPYGERQPF